ncbi:hypothetical protein C8Q77DRAFT_1151984 [Trametes polyzona]|nr:hypothetical protein C8Q77DRAFT_1151984 [Trametes polyzona]
MPPKPRPIRKPSNTPKDAGAAPAPKDAPAPSTSMPPPPDPLPPLGILEGEITALSSCFQQAVVKTGQIYGFYTDVKKLGIQKYAPHPPRSLTASLGREVEKYDQLCDAIESRLLRAIVILQRDLAREEQRLKAEEEAAAAAPKLPSPSSSTIATTTPPASPSQTQTETLPDGTQRPKPSVPTPARRQSTISLSSLQRPAFPHKLDLSASALRLHPEEMIPSGLSSPVTLAPRSARASLAPDLVMALSGGGDPTSRAVDIDLTVDQDMMMSAAAAAAAADGANLDSALGNSADKPIELDFDMEFLGDAGAGASGAAGQNIFDTAPQGGQGEIKPKVEDGMDMDILNALQSVGTSGSNDDLFASLSGAASSSNTAPATQSDPQKDQSATESADAFFASLGAPPTNPGDSSGSNAGMGPDHAAQIDLHNFALDPRFSEIDMMNVDEILSNMGVAADPSAAGSSNAS